MKQLLLLLSRQDLLHFPFLEGNDVTYMIYPLFAAPKKKKVHPAIIQKDASKLYLPHTTCDQQYIIHSKAQQYKTKTKLHGKK